MTIQDPSIVEQLQLELADVGSPVPTTALRALVGSRRGEPLPAERLGRVLGYERQSYLKTRRPPRVAVALNPDGTAASPQHLTDGDWRLVRRILTRDAVRGQAAALGIRLCLRAHEFPAARELLRPHIEQAAWAAFGSEASELLSADGEWATLYRRFLKAQPHAVGAYTAEQRDAEQALEAQHLSGLARYFGAEEPAATATALSTLRAPLPGEQGEAFDDLVRRRAGDPVLAREVLAFIEEWGLLVDKLEREPTLDDYAERWSSTEAQAKGRLELFHQILPDEQDPTAIWRLLWDSVSASGGGGSPGFLRLTSQPLIAAGELPALSAYFLGSLYVQLSRPLALQLHAAGVEAPEEAQEPARDLRRLYRLADRATHTWARAALLEEAHPGDARILGLDSLEQIHDDTAAAVAEQQIGAYRRSSSERKPRDVLLSVQKCLRLCADLDQLNPPSAITPLLPGARLAAAAVATLAASGTVDIVTEATATLSLLYATP
jgi:hypothetical protein